MKELFKIFLSMLVVSIMLIGTVGAESTDSTQDELFEDEYYFPDYGSKSLDSLMEESGVIEVRGIVPEITEDKEKIEWLDSIWMCINNSKDELDPYMKENGGPLVDYGMNYGGYLFVVFDEESKDEIDEDTLNKFYNTISAHEKEISVSDIPVVFKTGGNEILEGRGTYRTDMIGGINISTYNTTEDEYYGSTLGFAAQDSSGNLGFVISGHAVALADGIGGDVIQGGRVVGTADYMTAHFADAAWVEADNVDAQIYYDDNDDIRDVHSYDDDDLSVGSKVYISGRTTGLDSGYITDWHVQQNSNTFGTLYYQYSADYDSDNGDSGAPIFKKYGSEVTLVGIHRGHYDGDASFSPISGVILDLGVTPITT